MKIKNLLSFSLLMLAMNANAQGSKQFATGSAAQGQDLSIINDRLKSLEDRMATLEKAVVKQIRDQKKSEMEEIPLSQPNHSSEEIINWVKTSLVEIYSYNFNNYKEVLAGSRRLFTVAGYDSYMRALEDSKNLTTVQEKKLVVTAKSIGKGKLLSEETTQDTYTWEIEIPLEVTYTSPSAKFTQNINVTLDVARVKYSVNPEGVAIHSITAKIADKQPDQPISIEKKTSLLKPKKSALVIIN